MPEETRKGSGVLDRLMPVILVFSIVLAFVVGVLWQKVTLLEGGKTSKTDTQANQKTTTTTTADDAENPKVKLSMDQIRGLFKNDLVKFGDGNTKVVFIEISDPSCPYCHVAAGKNSELNKKIDTDSGGKTKFTLVSDGGTYRAPVLEMKKLVDSGKASYIYLYSIGHGNGEMGAKALYCAYKEDKFWPVHDLLMTSKGYDLLNNIVKNDKTKSQELSDFLKSAISADTMKKCLDGGEFDGRTAKDMQLAATLGAKGTPYFVINTDPFPGAYNYDNMEPLVESLLK